MGTKKKKRFRSKNYSSDCNNYNCVDCFQDDDCFCDCHDGRTPRGQKYIALREAKRK